MITSIKEYKKIIENNTNDNMLHINLLDKYSKNGDAKLYRQKFEEFKHKIDGFKESSDDLKYSVGDIIEFTSGYNDDIRYTTEILGFDSDNEIYLLWDAYWAPIKDNEIRDIKIVSNNKLNEQIINNKQRIINLEFEDQTDIKNDHYSFSFETVDAEGAPVLNYDGTIDIAKYERNPDDIEWGQNVPEDYDTAEEYILDEFYKWLNTSNDDITESKNSSIDNFKKYINENKFVHTDPKVNVDKIEHNAFGSNNVFVLYYDNKFMGFVYLCDDYWCAWKLYEPKNIIEFLDEVKTGKHSDMGTKFTADTYEEAMDEILTSIKENH